MAFQWIRLIVYFSKKISGTILVAILTLMLTACQTRAPMSENSMMDLQQCDLSLQETDDLIEQSRRLHAKTAIKSDELNEQATIIWQTSQDGSQHIRLHGPLGSNAVELAFDQHHAVLTDNKSRRYQRASASELLVEIIGWPLPIDALQYWLLGQALPGQSCQFKADNDGQMQLLLQNDWQVEYQDYRPYAAQVLPRKITASSIVDNKEVVVKLIVREWQWH